MKTKYSFLMDGAGNCKGNGICNIEWNRFGWSNTWMHSS